MQPKLSQQSDNLWTESYVALLAVNLLLCFGFYMLPATLPAYVKQLAGTNFEASLVIGMFSIMSLVSRVVSGTVVDSAGEKKVILCGIVIIAVTTLSFIWMPVDGILWLRSLQGIGWGLSTAAIATAVYKVVPEKRRGEGAGYYSLTVILSLSLTPLVAILLMNSFGFSLLLSASAVLTLAALLLLGKGLSSLPPLDTERRNDRCCRRSSVSSSRSRCAGSWPTWFCLAGSSRSRTSGFFSSAIQR